MPPFEAPWDLTRPHVPHGRSRRPIRPVVESIEGRLLLAAGTTPTETPTQPQLGAAYQEVVAIQTATLQALSDSHREVQAATAQFASGTAAAIDQLNAELSHVKNRGQAAAIATAIRRDRHIFNVGVGDADHVEQGLDVAQGVADQQANTDKIYIPIRVFTSLTELVRQDRSTGEAIARSGQRSANVLVRKLDALGDELTSTVAVRATR